MWINFGLEVCKSLNSVFIYILHNLLKHVGIECRLWAEVGFLWLHVGVSQFWAIDASEARLSAQYYPDVVLQFRHADLWPSSAGSTGNYTHKLHLGIGSESNHWLYTCNWSFRVIPVQDTSYSQLTWGNAMMGITGRCTNIKLKFGVMGHSQYIL